MKGDSTLGTHSSLSKERYVWQEIYDHSLVTDCNKERAVARTLIVKKFQESQKLENV